MNDVDHSTWDRLLQSHVSESGNVDYKKWHGSAKDVKDLDRYLNQLSAASQKLPASKQSKLAFWINAYNAVTVKGILREYPTTSIRNHTAKLFGYNIWDDLQLYVGGTAFSLNQMEHEILRKMNEPRIHFAIVCASKSCPRLLSRAFVASEVEEQLDSNAKHFFAQPANFQLTGNTVTLSSILKWFGEDFGSNQSAVMRRITPWLPAEAASSIDAARVKLNYAEYDWSLNGS
ncbi:DUF547 domain-containing protein [Rubripirellula obstinata]|nr:DUF547 domain-containing protein [Rubripirellula obstinata]